MLLTRLRSPGGSAPPLTDTAAPHAWAEHGGGCVLAAWLSDEGLPVWSGAFEAWVQRVTWFGEAVRDGP